MPLTEELYSWKLKGREVVSRSDKNGFQLQNWKLQKVRI